MVSELTQEHILRMPCRRPSVQNPIEGLFHAGILAAQMLSIKYPEIREKMNAVLINIQARELKSNREAIKLYHCFFEEKRSHNKTNFRTVEAVRDMGFEPLQRIAATTTVNRILELM